jgi:Holliday junction DNA helicase RuvA
MIALLNGRLVRKTTESVIVDVGGVGYELFIPLSTYYDLPETGGFVKLNVYTHIKEDALQLYGFATDLEKDVFELLISVSGVGPKLARNILSGVAVEEFIAALAEGDKARLNAIPGIGSKTADRLIVELRDKVLALKPMAAGPGRPGGHSMPGGPAAGDAVTIDVVSALANLGYRNSHAEDAVRKAREVLDPGFGFEVLFKESLRSIAKR